MAEPVTMATALVVAKIGAALWSGISGWGAARRARREARRLAGDAIDRGEEEVRRYELEMAQFLGTQRTRLAVQNVDLGYGDAGALRAEAVAFGLEDVETIRLNAQREARAIRASGRTQSNELRTQSAFSFLQAGVGAWDHYRGSVAPRTPSLRAPSHGVRAQGLNAPSTVGAPRMPAQRPIVGPRAPTRR